MKKCSKATTFDDVFRTIVQKMPWMMVAVINETFGTSYSMDVKIIQHRNEFHTKAGKIITDMLFEIEGRLYHMECQSNPDNTMEIRMIEYDFMIAHEQAIKKDGVYRMKMPESAVLYLRHNRNTPDKHRVIIELPDGKTAEYACKVIKVQNYSKDELFQKRLLAFIPFYLMRFEKNFKKIDVDKDLQSSLLSECEDLCKRLEADPDVRKQDTLYGDLIDLITRVSDHILADHSTVKRKVRKTMNGHVLELKSEKLLRKGRAEGKAEGRDEGADQVTKLYKYLMTSGQDAELQKAMDDVDYRKQLLKTLNL